VTTPAKRIERGNNDLFCTESERAKGVPI
jgi:hypothetical protein